MDRQVTVCEWLSITAVGLSVIAIILTCCGCETSHKDGVVSERAEVVNAAEQCLAVIKNRYGVEPVGGVQVYEIPVEEQNARGQGLYPYNDCYAGQWFWGWSIESAGEAWVSYPADTQYRDVLMHELQHLCGMDADGQSMMCRLASDTEATR